MRFPVEVDTAGFRFTFIDPDFRPRHRPGMQCYRCGKTIKDGSTFRVVHVVNSCCAVHPDDEAKAPLTDDWLPVGMDCARQIGLDFTHPAAMEVKANRNGR